MSAAHTIRYNPQRDICPASVSTGRDFTTRVQNIKLAAELTEWWAQRGYPQVTWEALVRTAHCPGGREPSWTVVSNLKNGLPPPKAGTP